MVSYRTGITILSFVFFVPTLLFSVYLCFRSGLKEAGAWRFIATLSALRVAGDVSYFLTLSNASLNIYVAVIVCELMGLAPLMLTCVALVGRINRITLTIPPKGFALISLMSLLGLILGIVGTDDALNDAATVDDVSVNGLMKAALALFLAGFGLMLVGYTVVFLDIKQHPDKGTAVGREARIFGIVAAATPFVVVRLVYAALGDYTDMEQFDALYGSDTVYLCMGVLMEIFATAIFLSTTVLVPIAPKDPDAEELDSQRGE